MIKIVSKYRLSLLEVLIALSLATILLSLVTTFYYQSAQKKNLAQELKNISLPTELAYQKLTHLLAQLTSTQNPLFYTKEHPDALGKCLYFSYHQPIDINPAFCGDLIGMLYLNNQQHLCQSHQTENKHTRQEVLLENIFQLKFSFFNPKTLLWESDWDSKNGLPPFFKISWSYMKTPKEIIECPFFFPQSKAQIIYKSSSNPRF